MVYTCYCNKMENNVCEIPSCIRGFHVYKDTWVPTMEEVLQCQRDRRNNRDRYATSVIKDGNVVGHLPQKISKICSLFMRRQGAISCRVTGGRRYSADLPQGGLELPCLLLFSGQKKEIDKIKRIFRMIKHAQL